MEVKVQSIHFDATEKLQAFIEKKTAKLEKSFEDIQKVEVQLKVVKPATALNKETSMTVSVPGNTLFVEKTCDTFEEGIDLCIDAMRFNWLNLRKNCAKDKKNSQKFWRLKNNAYLCSRFRTSPK